MLEWTSLHSLRMNRARMWFNEDTYGVWRIGLADPEVFIRAFKIDKEQVINYEVGNHCEVVGHLSCEH